MASPLQFAYRTPRSFGVFDADPVYESVPGFVSPEADTRCCAYSPCGRYVAWATKEVVTVCDASVGHALATLPVSNVWDVAFSPLGTFVSTWERPGQDANGEGIKNLKVWRTVEETTEDAARQPVGQFVQKAQSGWKLQYTGDEELCARSVTNEVHFYKTSDLSTILNKLRVEGLSEFSLSPGKNHAVAVFIPMRKGAPGAVRIYNAPNFANPVSQKTFFKCDKVQLKWNAQGSSLIVLTQTEVDKTNKSYYGETSLYLLSTNGTFDSRMTLDKEGPVYDVMWSPNSKEFGVVYGYTPPKTTIFSERGVAKHTLPSKPRNTIIFSPSGRFVLVGGFGNMNGEIAIYDVNKDYREVCVISGETPSVCEWSPDSRYIMTATTSPRLRVDNGIRLWHVGGGLIYDLQLPTLYDVVWRPLEKTAAKGNTVDPLTAVPVPHSSAIQHLATRKTPSKPVGAYRPPGARGMATPLHFKREDEGGASHTLSNGSSGLGASFGPSNGFGRSRRAVPGAELVELSGSAPVFVPGAEPAAGNEQLSKAALKNKKKRGNKKANKDEGGGAATATATASGTGKGISPERRGQHARDQSRNGNRGVRKEAAPETAPAPTVEAAAPATQSPVAKKIRSLQKKIRAIEDLEMRRAGGEKLEDTQIKKIGTKAAVLKELDELEKQA